MRVHPLTIIGIAFLLAAAAPLAAQEYEILGEIRGQTTYHYLEEAEQKHRLTAETEASAEHEFVTEQAEFRATTEYAASSTRGAEYEIPEAYLTLFPTAPLSVTAGKQTVEWGTSSRFNPADSLHTYDENNRREGWIGVRATYVPEADITLSGVATVDQTLDRSEEPIGKTLTGALVGNLYFGNVEVAPSFIYRYEQTLRPALALSAQAFGFVFYGQAGVELWNDRSYPESGNGSIAFEQKDLGDPYPVFSVGANRTLGVGSSDLTVSAEYLYSGFGYSEQESELLFDAVDTAVDAGSSLEGITEGAEEARLLGRHYLYGALELRAPELGALETTALVNAIDWSVSVEHAATLATIDSMEFELAVAWHAGMEGESEFGTLPVATEPGRVEAQLGTTFFF